MNYYAINNCKILIYWFLCRKLTYESAESNSNLKIIKNAAKHTIGTKNLCLRRA